MTKYIPENEFMDELELHPSFKDAIRQSFVEAVERQTDEVLDCIADLTNAAEVFVEFVQENGIEAGELDEAFAFFCEECGIGESDAAALGEFIAENFLVEEEDETIDEWAAAHIGSYELPDKSVVHAFDRGKKYHTLNRFVLKHHDKDGEHLDTHVARTADHATKIINDLSARQKSIAANTLSKEGVESGSLMESYLVNLKRTVGIYE